MLIFNRSDNYEYDGNINGIGNVYHTGPGCLTLTANNVWGGPSWISQGWLKIGTNTAQGIIGGNFLTNNGVLTVVRADTYQLTNTIVGSGVLVHTNTTVLAVRPVNINGAVASSTYTGGTYIGNGTVCMGAYPKALEY